MISTFPLEPRRAARLLATALRNLGDNKGHPFHGNQWTGGDGSSFKAWFGESKVVDDQGQPLVVYKAMYPYDWTKETKTERGPLIDSINRTSEFPSFHGDEPGVQIAGFFGDKKTANHFAEVGGGQAVYPVVLSIQKPYEIDASGKKAGDIQFGASGKPFRDAIRSGKYDGVIIRNTNDEGTVYVALKPEQIKTALGDFKKRVYDPASRNLTPHDERPDRFRDAEFNEDDHPRDGHGRWVAIAQAQLDESNAFLERTRQRLIRDGIATETTSIDDLQKLSPDYKNAFDDWTLRQKNLYIEERKAVEQERFDKVTRRATEVAREMGVDPSLVHVVDTEPHPFMIGNQQFKEAGHYDPRTGQVEINARNSYNDRMSVTNGIVAHELSHVMYDAVKKEQEREHAAIRTLPSEEFTRLFDVMGSPRPDTLDELKERFPASAAFATTWGDSYLSPNLPGTGRAAQAQRMIDENGHSSYAKTWWSARDPRWPSDSPLNETLAEVTRYMTHPLSWEENETPSPKSPWIQLSKDVQAAYKRIQK